MFRFILYHHVKLQITPISSLLLIVYLLISLTVQIPHAYGGESIAKGKRLPRIKLLAPDSKEAKLYLGIKDARSFTISQISSKFTLIEIFSLYCPICQKQAPIINKLYRLIQKDPKLSKDIKIIGIGAGNNEKEVDVYRKKYRISFPLFSDLNFSIHKKLGQPRTPFTFLVSSRGKILLTHFGLIENIEEFLQELKKYNQ
jgi:peroxiredoxin